MITDLIKSTCKRVAIQASNVKLNIKNLENLVSKIKSKPVYIDFFDFPEHIDKTEEDEDLIAYAFVLDALNFCFWPSDNGWEYGDLAKAIKEAHKRNKEFLKPEFLSKISIEDFKKEIFGDDDFPLMDERHRAVVEIGEKTVKYFDGKFSNILKKGNFEAKEILEIVASTFLMFQDHCIYKGRQVYFYKRAQILIGDLFGIFKSKENSEIEIKNVQELTCFADYRIPQILYHEGVLEYSPELKTKILEKEEMIYGCEFEVEIRACMVHCVEIMKDLLQKEGVDWTSVEVDWLLWQIGEEQRNDIAPHHRVLSIFY